MIKIGVLTSTRAEYGLMRPLLFKLRDDPEFDFHLLVTGTHLSPVFGMTIRDIVSDGVPVSVKIDILIQSEGTVDVPRTMAKAIVAFSDYFAENRFDLLFVDGDRYETVAVCIAAVNHHIPIAHCGGGETTEGASDEMWRHAITKMSILHFAIMDIYRDRIIRMGESPDRVCLSGSLGLENIRMMRLGTKEELESFLSFRLDKPYAVVTFHPVTLERNTSAQQVEELLNACSRMKDMKFIFTKSNIDLGGPEINRRLEEYAEQHKETAVCVASLGSYFYFTAVRDSEFVLGNSSSGIIEVPSLGVPTVNIGDRQKGRERALSIIDCPPVEDGIVSAMLYARTDAFREKCRSVVNPNGDGHASDRIIRKIKEQFRSGKLAMKKKFFDGEVSVDESVDS